MVSITAAFVFFRFTLESFDLQVFTTDRPFPSFFLWTGHWCWERWPAQFSKGLSWWVFPFLLGNMCCYNSRWPDIDLILTFKLTFLHLKFLPPQSPPQKLTFCAITFFLRYWKKNEFSLFMLVACVRQQALKLKCPFNFFSQWAYWNQVLEDTLVSKVKYFPAGSIFFIAW